MTFPEPVKTGRNRFGPREIGAGTGESTDRTLTPATETKGSITSPGYEEMRQ